jgi:tellurite resistance protein
MNFTDFIQETDSEFLLEANPRKGVTDKALRVKLVPDNTDRELFMRFSASFPDEGRNQKARQQLESMGLKPSTQLAAKVVRARYAVAAAHGAGANPQLQKDASEHNVYFTQPSGETATLVVGSNEIPNINIGFESLKHKLENYPVSDTETGNVKKELPRFTHPTVQGKISPRDTEGNPTKGKQTNGINKATLGISGHPSEVGWSIAYHRTGVKANKMTPEEEKYAEKPSSVDTSQSPEMGDEEERTRVKKLTAAGNNYVDNVLFNPTEMPSEMNDSEGNELTNKQVLGMIKNAIRRQNLKNVDPQDVLSAFAMQVRNKYGEFENYENAEKMINSLIPIAIHDAREASGHGRKAGEDLTHGKKYQMKAGSIEGEEDQETGKFKGKMVSTDDLKKRLDLRTPEYQGEPVQGADKEAEVPYEPRPQNIRTYKASHRSPDQPDQIAADMAAEKENKRTKDLYGAAKPEMPKDDIERASPEEMAARRQEFLGKVRNLAASNQPAATQPSSVLQRLRQKFKVA